MRILGLQCIVNYNFNFRLVVQVIVRKHECERKWQRFRSSAARSQIHEFTVQYTRPLRSPSSYPLSSCGMAPLNKKELPSKEKSLFRELLNHYETRQLKKGVKTADQILKKFPDNGGTSTVSHTDDMQSDIQLY